LKEDDKASPTRRHDRIRIVFCFAWRLALTITVICGIAGLRRNVGICIIGRPVFSGLELRWFVAHTVDRSALLSVLVVMVLTAKLSGGRRALVFLRVWVDEDSVNEATLRPEVAGAVEVVMGAMAQRPAMRLQRLGLERQLRIHYITGRLAVRRGHLQDLARRISFVRHFIQTAPRIVDVNLVLAGASRVSVNKLAPCAHGARRFWILRIVVRAEHETSHVQARGRKMTNLFRWNVQHRLETGRVNLLRSVGQVGSLGGEILPLHCEDL
jgi:hypothetical protein